MPSRRNRPWGGSSGRAKSRRADLDLRARIFFADGAPDNTVVLGRGDSTNVSVGEYVMVEAIGGEAAAGNSMYFLDIR